MGGGEGDAGAQPGAAGSELPTLHIRCANGSKFTVRAELSSTVADFKAIVAESCDVPAPQQRLIYKGRILKDDQTLASYDFDRTDSSGPPKPAKAEAAPRRRLQGQPSSAPPPLRPPRAAAASPSRELRRVEVVTPPPVLLAPEPGPTRAPMAVARAAVQGGSRAAWSRTHDSTRIGRGGRAIRRSWPDPVHGEQSVKMISGGAGAVRLGQIAPYKPLAGGCGLNEGRTAAANQATGSRLRIERGVDGSSKSGDWQAGCPPPSFTCHAAPTAVRGGWSHLTCQQQRHGRQTRAGEGSHTHRLPAARRPAVKLPGCTRWSAWRASKSGTIVSFCARRGRLEASLVSKHTAAWDFIV